MGEERTKNKEQIQWTSFFVCFSGLLRNYLQNYLTLIGGAESKNVTCWNKITLDSFIHGYKHTPSAKWACWNWNWRSWQLTFLGFGISIKVKQNNKYLFFFFICFIAKLYVIYYLIFVHYIGDNDFLFLQHSMPGTSNPSRVVLSRFKCSFRREKSEKSKIMSCTTKIFDLRNCVSFWSEASRTLKVYTWNWNLWKRNQNNK